MGDERRTRPPYDESMCRNITELRGLEPPASREEIEAAARQYVRKVTCVARPNPELATALEQAAIEIAEITELPVGTVKSRIFRARAPLRELVERKLGEKIG